MKKHEIREPNPSVAEIRYVPSGSDEVKEIDAVEFDGSDENETDHGADGDSGVRQEERVEGTGGLAVVFRQPAQGSLGESVVLDGEWFIRNEKGELCSGSALISRGPAGGGVRYYSGSRRR